MQILKNPKSSSKAKIEALYVLCYFDFELFVTTFFKHHCGYAFSTMHRDIFDMEWEPNRRGRRDVIAAPRGHAKTTFWVHFKVLHSIVYGYEQFIVILGHSAPESESKVSEILNELENNSLLKAVYGHLAPTRGKQGWSTKNFVTQNGIRVMAKSRRKQVRGLKHGTYRPTFIILDDIESSENVHSEEQRYKTKQWVEKDILKLGHVDGRVNIVIIGTCLHPEALLPGLFNAPGWQGKKYQAVLSFAINQGLWEQWKRIYLNLTNPNRLEEAEHFYRAHQSGMDEGTEVLWPEAESYLDLMKMILNEGQASFQSEKQNEPYDPTRQIFEMDQAKLFQVMYHPDGALLGFKWLDGSERMVYASQIMRVVAFHDPAMAESKDSDYAAIVVCAADEYGYLYCLDAYIEKVPPSRQIQQAIALYQKWRVNILYIEDNNFQSLMKHNYQTAQGETTYLRLRGVSQHTKKENRIATLEPLITNGQLLFNQDINPRLMTQLKLFPTTYDDGPDALQGAIEQLKAFAGRIKFNR